MRVSHDCGGHNKNGFHKENESPFEQCAGDMNESGLIVPASQFAFAAMHRCDRDIIETIDHLHRFFKQ